MKTKIFALSFIAYVVITFIFAAGWHLVLFKETYDALGIFTRKEPIIPLGLISMAIQGVLLPYLYSYFYTGGTPWKVGLSFGLIVGVLLASVAVFAEAGKNEVSSLTTWLVLESIYYLVQFGVVGIVLGMLFGRIQLPNSEQYKNIRA
ncbi:MAG TPA: DUF1761 domain-containing protein [Patescibacteria group bacterium]|nr:DUF1761 domain-containing protein [Patescibacteria group bacterium]